MALTDIDRSRAVEDLFTSRPGGKRYASIRGTDLPLGTLRNDLLVVEPRWPVFLIDGADIAVLRDADHTRRELEPWLTDAGGELLDSLARPTKTTVDRKGRRDTIALELSSDDANEVRLRDALVGFLRVTGQPIPAAPSPSAFSDAVAAIIA
jgi:hypothetical protein